MIGKRVEMLEVVRRLPGSKLVCLCDCGNERTCHVGHFNTGHIKSCGCHKSNHGHAKTRSREYICYHNMMARCHKRSNSRYSDYGGKGIHVSEDWRQSFENFYRDMGDCPEGYQIDRIDNKQGYSAENCRWVSPKANMANRHNTYIYELFGVSYLSSTDAAKSLNLSRSTVVAWCSGRTAKGRYYPPKKGCKRALRSELQRHQQDLLDAGLVRI